MPAKIGCWPTTPMLTQERPVVVVTVTSYAATGTL